MPDAGCCRGGGKPRRRQPVDAVIKLGRNAAADMGNAGKMDDLIDVAEQRAASRSAAPSPGAERLR
jgi:hypothetical protein